jgi:hypothetical protein
MSFGLKKKNTWSDSWSWMARRSEIGIGLNEWDNVSTAGENTRHEILTSARIAPCLRE